MSGIGWRRRCIFAGGEPSPQSLVDHPGGTAFELLRGAAQTLVQRPVENDGEGDSAVHGGKGKRGRRRRQKKPPIIYAVRMKRPVAALFDDGRGLFPLPRTGWGDYRVRLLRLLRLLRRAEKLRIVGELPRPGTTVSSVAAWRARPKSPTLRRGVLSARNQPFNVPFGMDDLQGTKGGARWRECV